MASSLPQAPIPQTVIASAGRRLEEFARLQQIDLAPLAQSVGIEVADLGRSDLRISLDAFMRLFHLLEIVSGDDCFGLRYALHFRQGDSGAFGFAILHAPTLREGLRIYQTYQRMVADNAHFDMTAETDEVTIRWRYTRLIDYPDQYTDFRAALLVKVIRGFLGPDWRPRTMALLRPRPRNTALHREFFGPGVSFQMASLNMLSIPAGALETRSGSDDPRLFEMMEAACRTALEAIDRSRDLRLQVIEQILALLPWGAANLTRVAGALAMGERSLQRRLGELDTNFEQLVDQTRRDLSDRLLGTATPLSEISYLCGYSNASAYSRAARGWYGMSPLAMRQRLRATAT